MGAPTRGTVAFAALMPRPIVLGVVGDSGAGKTTLTRGLVRVLGDGNVAHLSADDYHRYDRHERHSLGITPLHPDANYLDILTQHLGHLRDGAPVLKPVYNHRTGKLGAPRYLRPAPYLVVEGLLSFHTETLRGQHDVRVFLAPLVDDTDDGPRLAQGEGELLLRIPGDIDPDHAAVLEEAVWERMSFASHLRVRRLGEFTVGTDLLRSESLALVQVILLYHLVSARAALAVGGRHRRSVPSRATGADSALHAELPGRP